MSDRLIYAYAADIVKSTPNEDGSLTVYGKAAGNDLDLDEQRCDPTWLKGAMADWFSRWGNIREGHDPHRAIGVATELESLDNADQFITAKVVDPLAVTKINEKVLKGFSIGIKGARIRKAAEAPAGLICGGTIVETSVVDNASNQTCKFVVAKAVGNDVIANHWDAEPADTTADELRAEIAKLAGTDDIAEVLAQLAPRDGTLAKHATPDQSALLASAMRNVAKLIASEAAEMASTGRDEISDLRLLLDAVSALKWFSISEANEPTSEEDDMPLTLAALSDVIKAATPDEKAALAALLAVAPTEDDKPVTKGAEPDETPATDAAPALDGDKLKTDIIDAVKAALADTKKGVDDALAEVKKMAAPGGPMRMAPGTTKGAEPDDKATQRAYYLRQAENVTDPTLAAGYRAKADALR